MMVSLFLLIDRGVAVVVQIKYLYQPITENLLKKKNSLS